MVATAQRYAELHPDVRIHWELRSLQAFADQSISTLSRQYDLLVVDHPSIGEAAEHRLFVALDDHLPSEYLQNQADHSVGASHASYQIAGHQWALATDAATPVSAARPDVLARAGHRIPQTWEELLELARAGLVAFAGLKLDCLMLWYSLCINEGEEPFRASHRIVDPETGGAALQALRSLVLACGSGCLQRNPIATYELMTTSDAFGYSPFAYGYSNYARKSYVDKPLVFGGLVHRNGQAMTSTLGGAGLAISSQCQHVALATDYAGFVGSEFVQRGLYTESGGQPGHRTAWLDADNNRLTGDFFRNTLQTLDDAYLRPRYPSYIDFQEHAPSILLRFLEGHQSVTATLSELDELDRRIRHGRLDERIDARA
jgi:multiple sugar transport system substrate-binding protein